MKTRHKSLKQALSPQPSGEYMGFSTDVLSPVNGAINVTGTDKVQSPVMTEGKSVILRVPGNRIFQNDDMSIEDNISWYVHNYLPQVMNEVVKGDKRYRWNNISRTPLEGNEGLCDIPFIQRDEYDALGIGEIPREYANKYGTALYFQMHANTMAEFGVYVFPKILKDGRNIADGETWTPFENLPDEWTNTHPYGKRMRSLKCWESIQLGMVEPKPFNYAKGKAIALPRGRFSKVLKAILKYTAEDFNPKKFSQYMKRKNNTGLIKLAAEALSDIRAGKPVMVATTDVFKLNKPGKYTHEIGIREYMNEQKKDKRSFADQLLTRVVLEALHRGEEPMLYKKYTERLASLNLDDIIQKGRERGQMPFDILSSMDKKTRVNADGYYGYAISPFIYEALWPRLMQKLEKEHGVFCMVPKEAFKKAKVRPGYWVTNIRYPIVIPEAAMSMRCFCGPIKGVATIGAISGISATDIMAEDFDGDYKTISSSKQIGGINHRKVARSEMFKMIFLNSEIAGEAADYQKRWEITPASDDQRLITLEKEIMANTLVAMADYAIKQLSYLESEIGPGRFIRARAILAIVYQEAMSGMKHSGNPVGPSVANAIVRDAVLGKNPTEAQSIAFAKKMGQVARILKASKNCFAPSIKKYEWFSDRGIDAINATGTWHRIYGPKLTVLRDLVNKINCAWETAPYDRDGNKCWKIPQRINPTMIVDEINSLKETCGKDYGKLVKFMVWFLGDQSQINQQYLPVPNGSQGGEKLRFWNSLLRVDINEDTLRLPFAGCAEENDNWFKYAKRNHIKVAVGNKQIKARILGFLETVVALAAGGEKDQKVVFDELSKVLKARQMPNGAPGYHMYDLYDYKDNPVGANHPNAWPGYTGLIGKNANEIEEIVYSAFWHAISLILGPVGNRTGQAMRYIVEDSLFFNCIDSYQSE